MLELTHSFAMRTFLDQKKKKFVHIENVTFYLTLFEQRYALSTQPKYIFNCSYLFSPATKQNNKNKLISNIIHSINIAEKCNEFKTQTS